MILTRRNFLRSILPAAIAAPVLVEELLHPGRVFFLPLRNITIYQGYEEINIEAIVRQQLSRDLVAHLDEIARKSFFSLCDFGRAKSRGELVRASLFPALTQVYP